MSQDSTLGSNELEPSSNPSHSLTDYEYEPLPTSPATIRLCKIHPSSSPALEEPVVCEIHHSVLDTAASMGYCALSYAWGEPKFDHVVKINGCHLRVTSHLCKALQRLRSHSLKWVWVDAICIDQFNIPERNAQVSLMGQIYSSAESTIIYLGEADTQETKAVGLMLHLSALSVLLKAPNASERMLELISTVLDRLADDLGPDHPYIEELGPPSGAVSDGAVSDGAVSDGTVSDGAVSDGAMSDSAMSGGAASDGAMSDGAMSDGAMSDGAMSNGAISDGTMSDGAMSDGAMSDGAMSDGAMSDSAVSEGAISDGPVPEFPPIGSADECLRYVRLLGLPGKDSPLWASLSNIYQRPWFSRGWIVQEAVLSRQAIVIVGDDHLGFERVTSSLRFILELELHSHSIVRLPLSILTPFFIDTIRQGNRSRNLVHLLELFQESQTTDPRDKIYSLLGIADDVRMAPKPDYSQSVEAVYRSYAVHFIRNCEGLNLIRRSGIANGTSRADATWVPRWDNRPGVRSIENPFVRGNNFHAFGQVQANFEFEEELSLLRVRGVRFDSTNKFCSQTFDSDNFKDWTSWERSLSHSIQQSPRFSTERYAEALVMDGNGEGIGRYSSRFAVPNLTLKDAYESNFNPQFTKESQPRPYVSHVREIASSNRFVLTSRGHFGWVPKEAETSDIICIIFGVSVPLVLREVEDGRYILIGNAYIEGIMQGEAMTREDLIVEDFTLT